MKKTLLCDGWMFERKKLPPFVTEKEKKKEVRIPHDYAIKSTRHPYAFGGASDGFFQGGCGEYSRFLNFEENTHAIIQVDGAYAASNLYFNRDLCEFHPSGYAPYLTDLTNYIVPGKPNKLMITTDDSFFARWYTGAGLYRDVYLWTGGSVRVEPWDYFAYTAALNGSSAELVCDVQLSHDCSACGSLVFTLSCPDADTDFSTSVPFSSSGKGKTAFKIPLTVQNARPWSPDDPYLYDAALKVISDSGEELDRCEWKLGIRRVEVSAEKGFLLNGKPLKLRGGCIHNDHGAVGAVSLPAAEERKISRLKAVGFNAIRSSHNPPSTVLMETCDRLGVLVMDELFDVWFQPKQHMGYNLFIRDYWQQDTVSSVKRDRNHPCIVSYSCGNEVYERDERWEGASFCKKIASLVRRIDPTLPVTLCINGISRPPLYSAGDGQESVEIAARGAPVTYNEEKGTYSYEPAAYFDLTEKLLEPLDMTGYNYQFRRYEEIHEKYPERVFWGSETQVLHFYESWKKTAANPYIIGDFTWTAWDNIGEAGTGRFMWERDGFIPGISLAAYPWRTCFQGDFDLAGFRRPQSYFRRALWQPDAELGLFTTHPMHTGEGFSGTNWHWFDVNARWNYGEEWTGKDTVCEAYTTADRVEFYINGRLAAETVPVEAIARVTLPYEPGVLEAVAYRGEKPVGRAKLETTGPAAKVDVCAERQEFSADMRDLCYFDITITDKDGRRIADSSAEITAEVSGGKLVCIFSGDPANEDDYASDSCHCFCGRAVAVVQADAPGSVTLTVKSPGLTPGTATSLAK